MVIISMMKSSVISSLLGLLYLATMAAGQYSYKIRIGLTSERWEWYTYDTVCIQRLLKGSFVGRMSCRADYISSYDAWFVLDAGPTEFTGDTDDYIVMTQSGNDALFIDSLWVHSTQDKYAKHMGLKGPSTKFEKTWGINTNANGWCLSTDINDNDWDYGSTGRCYKTLLFSMNNRVYYWDQQHLCIRPRWGCEDPNDYYRADTDCDGDGFTDHTCHHTPTGRYWVVKSTDMCTGNQYHGGGNWKEVTKDACSAAFNKPNVKDLVNQGRAGWGGGGRRIEGQPALAPVDGEAVPALIQEAQELPAPANSVLGRLLKATQAPGGTPTPAPAVSTPQAPQSDRQLEEAVLMEKEQFENL